MSVSILSVVMVRLWLLKELTDFHVRHSAGCGLIYVTLNGVINRELQSTGFPFLNRMRLTDAKAKCLCFPRLPTESTCDYR